MESYTGADHTVLNVNDLVMASSGEYKTPARIIEVMEKHDNLYYKIHFIERSVLKKVILPAYRLKKYTL